MTPAKVLVVEDDIKLAEAIQETLELAGQHVQIAHTGEQAFSFVKTEDYCLILSDVNLGKGIDGIKLLNKIKQHDPKLPVIIMTAFASIDNAVAAMQAGAKDYIVKPFSPKQLTDMVSSYALKVSLSKVMPIAVSHKMQAVLALAARVANSRVTVLIQGDSGTGKEVMARYIHHASGYSEGPFVAINCAAIPENMLEAMLFGYEKGAFTGAISSVPGKFELAQLGTIFLDEISELPLALQAKLLRVLQEKEVERLGGKKIISLNLRVIAATNKHLQEAVHQGQFREDLYFRLSVFPIYIPPLRERQEDILPLASYLIKNMAEQHEMSVPTLTKAAEQYLRSQSWPGNVRELDNVLQRAMILHQNEVIDVAELTPQGMGPVPAVLPTETMACGEQDLDEVLKHQEYRIILKALEESRGSREKTAAALGISPRTLRHKIAKMRTLGIAIPETQKT